MRRPQARHRRPRAIAVRVLRNHRYSAYGARSIHASGLISAAATPDANASSRRPSMCRTMAHIVKQTSSGSEVPRRA